jgi:DNA-binding CsgD family transcriptional regulator
MAQVGEPLSEREVVVLERLVDGSTNREIAQDLSISPNTVKVHLRNIFTKLGVSSRTEAITVAIQKGILTVPGTDDESVPNADSTGTPVTVAPDATDSDSEIKSTPAQTAFSHWRLISAGLLLVVVLLVGVLFGPQLTGQGDGQTEESTEESPDQSGEQPLGDSDWLIARPLPSERANMALVAVGLELYQIAGEVEAGVVNLVDVFETGSGRWRSAESKPTAVSDASADVLFGEIYVPGGKLADGQPTAIVEAYSPANNAWRPVTPLPNPVAGGVTMSDNGMLYVFGGWDGQDYLREGYVYDPGTDIWKSLPPMQEARAQATGGVLSDGLYVVGGYNGVEELKVCELYDPAQEKWFSCTPMMMSRSEAGAAVLGNNRLFVIGGGIEGGVPFGEVLDIRTDSWQEIELPMLQNATSWHGLGVTNVETRIFALGGRQDEKILQDSFIFTPFIHQTFLPAVGGDN